MNEGKTILEVAQMLGVTKNAIKYQVKNLSGELTSKTDKGIIIISPEGIAQIREKMKIEPDKEPDNNQQTTSKQTGQQPDKEPLENHSGTIEKSLIETIEILRDQLRTKDEQIERLNDQLSKALQLNENNQILLKQSQDLALIPEKIVSQDPETVIQDPAEEPKPAKKRSFLQRLFGGDDDE